ncbi:helix-turn-helix transcriptional regulator [Ferrimicrobium sp.]|uniref:helix-turn-helix domain-containing protein n=1 Tax=Ferrimicrobium sp. TaxID=2926050 RepID=UPI00260BDF6F|nr:helix-turn-helix transcriptional regulator [Ferrimicrobium sp.]
MEDARTQLALAINQAFEKSTARVQDVAELLHVDTSSISRWRRGTQRCPASRVHDLAKALGMSGDAVERLYSLALEAEKESQSEQRSFRQVTLKQELGDVMIELRHLEQKVSTLHWDIGFLNQNITGLKSQLANFEETFMELKAKLANSHDREENQ